MRIDWSHPGCPFMVWHVPICSELVGVRWVDDERAQWAVLAQPIRIIGGNAQEVVHQARKIVVQPGLILIDPVDDADFDAVHSDVDQAVAA